MRLLETATKVFSKPSHILQRKTTDSVYTMPTPPLLTRAWLYRAGEVKCEGGAGREEVGAAVMEAVTTGKPGVLLGTAKAPAHRAAASASQAALLRWGLPARRRALHQLFPALT